MKVIIVRTSPTIMNINSYNVQEIGLAKSLNKKGIVCDILLYCGKDSSHIDHYEYGGTSFKIYWRSGIGILRQSFFKNMDEIYTILKEYDVIQINEYNQISSYRFLKKFPNKCIIYEGLYPKGTFLMDTYYKIFDFLFLS